MGEAGAHQLDAAPDRLPAPEPEQLEMDAGAVAGAQEGEVGAADAGAGQIQHRRSVVDAPAALQLVERDDEGGELVGERRGARIVAGDGATPDVEAERAAFGAPAHVGVDRPAVAGGDGGQRQAELQPVTRASLEQAKRAVQRDRVTALGRGRHHGEQAQELERAKQVAVRPRLARAHLRHHPRRAQQHRLGFGQLETGGDRRGRPPGEVQEALAGGAVREQAALDLVGRGPALAGRCLQQRTAIERRADGCRPARRRRPPEDLRPQRRRRVRVGFGEVAAVLNQLGDRPDQAPFRNRRDPLGR